MVRDVSYGLLTLSIALRYRYEIDMAALRPFDDNIYIGAEEQVSKQPNRFAAALKNRQDLILGGTAVILFMALWEWAGTSGAINPLFSSSPSRVFNAFIKLASQGELGH